MTGNFLQFLASWSAVKTMAQLYMTLYNMMIYLGFVKKGFQKLEHQQFEIPQMVDFYRCFPLK